MTTEKIELSRTVNVYLISMLQFLFGRNLIRHSQAKQKRENRFLLLYFVRIQFIESRVTLTNITIMLLVFYLIKFIPSIITNTN